MLPLKYLVVFSNWFQSKSIRKKLKTKWFKNIQLTGKCLLNIEMSYASFSDTKNSFNQNLLKNLLLSGTSSLIDLIRPTFGIKYEFLVVQEKISY